jgi:excisionase family DNA binding protein
MEQEPEPGYFTTAEMADLFRVHRSTILRWAKRGDVASIRPMDGKRLYPANQYAIKIQRRLMENGQTPTS